MAHVVSWSGLPLSSLPPGTAKMRVSKKCVKGSDPAALPAAGGVPSSERGVRAQNRTLLYREGQRKLRRRVCYLVTTCPMPRCCNVGTPPRNHLTEPRWPTTQLSYAYRLRISERTDSLQQR